MKLLIGTIRFFCLLCALRAHGIQAGSETIRHVADANRIPLESLTNPIRFDFTGTVLRAGGKFITFLDKTAGAILVCTNMPSTALRHRLISTQGEMTIAPEDKSRRFFAEKISVLGPSIKQQPITVSARDIASGKYNFLLVKTQGVISSCILDEVDPNYYWAELNTENGKCYVTINSKALANLLPSALIDSKVELTGTALPITGLRQGLGQTLRVYDASEIKILKSTEKDPFSSYPLSENSITPHRQFISGDVVAIENKNFFIKTSIGRIILVQPTSETLLPLPGENVTVAGFPKYSPYALCLAESLVKKNGPAQNKLDDHKFCTINELFTNAEGMRRFKSSATGHRIKLQGKVISCNENELEISDGKNSVFVELKMLLDSRLSIPPNGSLIEVTGLCWSEFKEKTPSGIFPSFLRFKIYPYCADDVNILQNPPWWTPLKLISIIGMLLAILLILAIWNYMLNRRAELRGKKLYEERVRHALARNKVEERTHLAVELHDSISQTLTGVALHLDGGETAKAMMMLASCREELRNCIWDLRSRTFEEKDMNEAIEHTIAPHLDGAKAIIRFNVPRSAISESATHAVLRIVRELVANAVHHGRAKQIQICGEIDGDIMSFSVEDDGCGFDPSDAPGPNDGHFGLLGIRERIEYFNGELEIKSAPGDGTKITISLNTEESDDGN